MSKTEENTIVVKAKPVRKTFRAKKITKIPQSITEDAELQKAIGTLPENYNFEIPKTVWRIKETGAKTVALQMPEGLLLFSTTISDLLRKFTGSETIIMGDVTYGACCIDDLTARCLGVDLLIHYGHSCLVPISQTDLIKVLYVFVDIKIDPEHFYETVKLNIDVTKRIGLVSTIQFLTTLHAVADDLKRIGYEVTLPQSKPLSAGEILGCTAPVLKCCDAIVYLGDGRFHLEAIMISNPEMEAYKYDPYEKKFTKEYYNYQIMIKERKRRIDECAVVGTFGVIMGTLGRQGNPLVVEHLRKRLVAEKKKAVVILLSEVFPKKLDLFTHIEGFVQVACPRLSIDWGRSFKTPVLTPYELSVSLGAVNWRLDRSYPMDYYANESLGPWTPNHKEDTKDKKECCGKCP